MSAFDLFCVVRDKDYTVLIIPFTSVERFSGLTGDFVLCYQRGPVIHPSGPSRARERHGGKGTLGVALTKLTGVHNTKLLPK